MHKDTTADDIFGPLSLSELENDRYTRITKNKLPEAEFAYLDEIFKSSSTALNHLLPIMNERIFYNDGAPHKIPLLTLVAASNEIPDSDDGLEAMYDRFNLKYIVKPIQEKSGIERMLMNDPPPEHPSTTIDISEIHKAVKSAQEVEFNSGMAGMLIKIKEALNKQGIYPTDRTLNVSKRIIKSEAFLKGRRKVKEEDFEVLKHVFWSEPENVSEVITTILELVNPEKNYIRDLVQKAREVAKDALSETDEREVVERGIDTTHKLTNIRKKIYKKIQTMEDKGKDTKEVKQFLNEIDELTTRVFEENCNINPDELKK